MDEQLIGKIVEAIRKDDEEFQVLARGDFYGLKCAALAFTISQFEEDNLLVTAAHLIDDYADEALVQFLKQRAPTVYESSEEVLETLDGRQPPPI